MQCNSIQPSATIMFRVECVMAALNQLATAELRVTDHDGMRACLCARPAQAVPIAAPHGMVQ